MADRALNFDMAEDITTKLIYLERRLAGRVARTPISIYDLPKGNEPQEYADALCARLGLPRLPALTARLPEGVMGLYTRQGRFCKIEVAPEAVGDRAVLMAVLAHELTHHYLFTNSVVVDDREENEVLTDVATVYLGMGKAAVNGCFTTVEAYNRKMTVETGYIKQDCFIYAYFLLCKVCGVDEADQLSGLNDRAIDVLYSVHATAYYQKMVRPYLDAASRRQSREKILSSMEKLNKRIERLKEDARSARTLDTARSLERHFIENRQRFTADYDAGENVLGVLLKIHAASHALGYIRRADEYISEYRRREGL